MPRAGPEDARQTVAGEEQFACKTPERDLRSQISDLRSQISDLPLRCEAHDGLHVMSLWEHIKCCYRVNTIFGRQQFLEISSQSSGVTRDIGYLSWPPVQYSFDYAVLSSRARRIE